MLVIEVWGYCCVVNNVINVGSFVREMCGCVVNGDGVDF